MIAPDRPDVPLEIARSIVNLRFSEAQNARMRELAERNNQGRLTEDEREEMESYRRVGNFLALLQSKARLSIKRASQNNG